LGKILLEDKKKFRPVAKLNLEADEKATKRRGEIFGFDNRKTTKIIFDDICLPLYLLFILGSGAVQRKPVSEENNVLQYNTLWNVNPRQFRFFPLYTQPSLSSPIPRKGRGKSVERLGWERPMFFFIGSITSPVRMDKQALPTTQREERLRER
jgi:hypothetical protein